MRHRRSWRVLGIALLIAWQFVVFAAFYLIQKPFGLDMVRAAMRSALDIAVALAIVGMGSALGRRFLIWLGLSDIGTGDVVWLAPALGLGGLSLISLGIGLVGVWRRPFIYGLALLAIGVLAKDGWAVGRQLSGWRPRLLLGRWGGWYLALTLGLTLMLALTPPISWDGLFYHLTGPALYIAQGRIAPLDINIPHLAFPSLLEMLYGLAMLLRGDGAAKLLHLIYGLLLAALVYRFSRRWQGQEEARWSLLPLVGMPMIAVLAAWAYNDLALALYQLAALYALLAWQETGRRGWLRTGGILTGLALGLKYTAFSLPLIGLAYLLISRPPRFEQAPGRWRAACAFALLAGLVAAPWYVRNWAFTGNPVYPFVFGGRNWDAFRSAWYAHSGTGIGWNLAQILALPVTMTLGLRDVNYYDGRMGPLVLALAPALVWLVAQALRRPGRSPRRRALMLLGAFSAVNALIWVLGVIQSRALFQARLFLPGFVALMPLLSEAIVRLSALDRPRFSLSAFVRMLVGVALALNLVSQAREVLRINPSGYLAGQEDRTAYLRRILGDHYRAMEVVGQEVPPDGRVLFLWEPRSYYCPRRAQPDAILDSWSYLVYRYGDETQIAAHLRTEGYSHVLLYQWGLDFVVAYGESPLPPQDVERLEAFIDRYLVLVEAEGHYQLYRLREG